MRTRIPSSRLAPFLLLVGMPCLASATPQDCPLSILERPTVLRAEAGWQAITSPKNKRLHHVGIHQGNTPSEIILGALVPNETSPRKGIDVDEWRFIRTPNERLWLGCNYEDTSVLLVRELPPEVTACTVHYAMPPRSPQQTVTSIDCK